MSNKVVFIACGSFNPPTFMHMRMFEIAKDHFSQMGYEVLGGIMSPVHDAYGKKGLVSQTHRHAMLKIATQSSDWIKISDWEMQQEGWSRTKQTLQFHQNYINSIIRDLNGLNTKSNLPGWLPEKIRQTKDPVQLKLLCGADLIESFATPGLWDPDDIAAIIGNHGIVVISRNGSDLDKFIFDSDLLSKYKRNITIVTNWIPNEVSSTLVRKFIKRELSVKYLIDDLVIDYINKHGLYQTASTDDTRFILPPSSTTSVSTIDVILTPISPESETSTYNESYVKKLNERNESSAVEEFESMDEGDFPVPQLPPAANKANLTVDFVSTNSLQKVFCCASADGTNVRILPRPGSAVQVHGSGDESIGRVDKVIDAQNAVNKAHDDDFGAPDDTDETQSPRSPEQPLNAQDDDQTDSESLNAPNSSKISHGRFSPKSYDEMIKFVFTEHGIKVISDKEYVV